MTSFENWFFERTLEKYVHKARHFDHYLKKREKKANGYNLRCLIIINDTEVEKIIELSKK